MKIRLQWALSLFKDFLICSDISVRVINALYYLLSCSTNGTMHAFWSIACPFPKTFSSPDTCWDIVSQKHSFYPGYLSVDICGHFSSFRNLVFSDIFCKTCLLKNTCLFKISGHRYLMTFVFSNLVQSSKLQNLLNSPAGCLLLGLLQRYKNYIQRPNILYKIC